MSQNIQDLRMTRSRPPFSIFLPLDGRTNLFILGLFMSQFQSGRSLKVNGLEPNEAVRIQPIIFFAESGWTIPNGPFALNLRPSTLDLLRENGRLFVLNLG